MNGQYPQRLARLADQVLFGVMVAIGVAATGILIFLLFLLWRIAEMLR